MSESSVLTSEQRQRGLWLTFNRPAVHNALDGELVFELTAAVRRAQDDDQVRYIVLTGAGQSFCAGADLAWMRTAGQPTADGRPTARPTDLPDLLDLLARGNKPVVAHVNGAALGGGMGIVAACDLAVAVPRASFGLSEVRLGLVPAMIFPFLLRRVQRSALLWAALSGERFRADRACAMGLINEVSDDPDAVVKVWAEALIAGGPQALASVKDLFFRVPQLSWEDARRLTAAVIEAARQGAEGQEGLRAFFEKRPPRWAEPA